MLKQENTRKYHFVITSIFILVFCCPFLSFLRVQCRSGMCTTPVQVTSSQLIASEVFPLPVVKGLLYPGAIVNGLITNMHVPSWNNLLSIYNLTDIKEASAITDLQRLEVYLLLPVSLPFTVPALLTLPFSTLIHFSRFQILSVEWSTAHPLMAIVGRVFQRLFFGLIMVQPLK